MASVFMKEFEDSFPRLLDNILAREVDHRIGNPCKCATADPCSVRCTDCVQSEPMCPSCFITSHQCLPFHWAERWNGRFFERLDISDLDHIICLGHSGLKCPRQPDNSKAYKFTLCDQNGIHSTIMLDCDCFGSGDRCDQLMRAGVFPGSLKRPETGFTFALLKDYHMLTLESKKSPYDFVSALRRRTNNTSPWKVPVSYQSSLSAPRLLKAIQI